MDEDCERKEEEKGMREMEIIDEGFLDGKQPRCTHAGTLVSQRVGGWFDCRGRTGNRHGVLGSL